MPLALLGASKLGPLAAGFGTRGCFLPAFNPDVWPPSNPSRRGKVPQNLAFHRFRQALAQWAVFQRLSLRTFGRPQTLPGRVRLPLAAGFGTMGFFLPAFNPDVWPPSNASRRGKVATGSARGLKTWLFTVRAGFGTLGCFLTAFTPDVWPPSNPPRQGTAAAGCSLWHNGLFFTGFQSGRLAATWLFTVRAGFGTMGCVLTAFNPDVWPPSNPPWQGTVASVSHCLC